MLRMAEYIDREAALALVRPDDPIDERYAVTVATAKRLIRHALTAAPAADVAPVVHGQWDDIPNEYMSVVSKTVAYHGNATTCSVCHDVNPNAFKINYCPNCGAKMDGGGSDATD